MTRLQKPGERPQKPGVYIERRIGGGQVPNPNHATMDPSDGHLPPTSQPRRTWEPVKPAKKS